MKSVIGAVVVGWIVVVAGCSLARADGGSLRFSGKRGDYQIAIFTAPTPFRSGPVDISVLVQDIMTGEALPDARVQVRMTRLGRHRLECPATTEAATNKLFQAAQFELPEAGRWKLEIEVEGSHGPVVMSGDVEAGEPLPRLPRMWMWFSWPALPIALFAIHKALSRGARGVNVRLPSKEAR